MGKQSNLRKGASLSSQPKLLTGHTSESPTDNTTSFSCACPIFSHSLCPGLTKKNHFPLPTNQTHQHEKPTNIHLIPVIPLQFAATIHEKLKEKKQKNKQGKQKLNTFVDVRCSRRRNKQQEKKGRTKEQPEKKG